MEKSSAQDSCNNKYDYLDDIGIDNIFIWMLMALMGKSLFGVAPITNMIIMKVDTAIMFQENGGFLLLWGLQPQI